MTITESTDDRTMRLSNTLDAIAVASRDTRVQQRIRERAHEREQRAHAIAYIAEQLDVLYVKAARNPAQAGSPAQRHADAILLVDAVDARLGGK